jgi:hypothetical protein
MVHAVALDRGDDRVVLGLVDELRRVHADDDEHVGELASSGRSSSMTCRQLMQQKVQKSSSTILPRRSRSAERRPSVPIQPPEPTSSGARTRAVLVTTHHRGVTAIEPGG